MRNFFEKIEKQLARHGFETDEIGINYVCKPVDKNTGRLIITITVKHDAFCNILSLETSASRQRNILKDIEREAVKEIKRIKIIKTGKK